MTIYTFVCKLLETNSPDILHTAHTRGWLEDQDERFPETPLDKRTAARILHSFMQKELHIPDLPDITAAEVLKDLYTCHACVNHVAQVYLHGIIPAEEVEVNGESALIFNMNRVLEDEEISVILKMFQGDAFFHHS